MPEVPVDPAMNSMNSLDGPMLLVQRARDPDPEPDPC